MTNPRKHMLTIRMLLFSLITMVMSYASITTLTSFASTYRCEDTSGVTVLTDSPAQLQKCTVLVEDPSIKSRETKASHSDQPTSLQTHSDIPESRDESREYSFIDKQDEKSLRENSDVVIIPVTHYGGSLLVTVQLNHTRQARLILDTGATMTVLSNDVALDLGLIASTKTQLTTVNTAGGQIQVNVTKISSIQAGTAQVKNVDVAIHDLPDSSSGIDGLLGMSFLNHFLVTLDTNQGQLHLTPRS